MHDGVDDLVDVSDVLMSVFIEFTLAPQFSMSGDPMTYYTKIRPGAIGRPARLTILIQGN